MKGAKIFTNVPLAYKVDMVHWRDDYEQDSLYEGHPKLICIHSPLGPMRSRNSKQFQTKQELSFYLGT